MKRIVSVLVCLILCFIMMFSFTGCSDDSDSGTIKIGSIHPLTGSMAYEGQALVNSQKIAVDYINENGGINGKMLELKVVDSLGTAGGSATAAQKLINMNVCALTGTYTSGSAQVVSRTAEKAGIPFVVTVAASDTLLKNGYKYSFRIQPSTVTFSSNFIEYLSSVKTDDMKTVAFIYEDSNYGTGIAEYIEEHIDETGLEIVGMISYSASASTLSSEVTKLISLDPDIVVPIGYYSDQSLFAKEIIDRKVEFPCVIGVANGAFSDAKFTATYGEKADGFFDINYRYNPYSEETEYLLSTYREKYGEEIPVCAIYGYESIMVLADALRRAGTTDAEALRQALAETEMGDHVLPQGAIKFDETGENINSAGVMIQIQNGKHVIVYPKEYAEGEIILKKEAKK
ncbi:MAG: ABC transporter substrate-binding protein [Clostridia bacterium]|nr:ABC transporter substrate-binding protein [Clostridia bacterium]